VSDPCPICGDAQRDQRTIAVVEEPLDVLGDRAHGGLQGAYHVLHGAISPVERHRPGSLRIRELTRRVDKGGVAEVIITATNPGLEGTRRRCYVPGASCGGQGRASVPAGARSAGGQRRLDIRYSNTLTRALIGRSGVSERGPQSGAQGKTDPSQGGAEGLYCGAVRTGTSNRSAAARLCQNQSAQTKIKTRGAKGLKEGLTGGNPGSSLGYKTRAARRRALLSEAQAAAAAA
jgi:hypothetical protein